MPRWGVTDNRCTETFVLDFFGLAGTVLPQFAGVERLPPYPLTGGLWQTIENARRFDVVNVDNRNRRLKGRKLTPAGPSFAQNPGMCVSAPGTGLGALKQNPLQQLSS